jgi:small-conductance mechanosensitive channel
VLLLTAAAGHSQQATEMGAPQAEAADVIPVGEIAGRAKRVIERLRGLESELLGDPLEAELEEELVRLAEAIEPRVPEVGAVLATAPSLATLESLRATWKSTQSVIEARERRLRDRVSELELEVAQLFETQALWLRTAERSLRRGAPESIMASAEVARNEVERVLASIEGSLNDVLVLQSQFADLGWSVRETLELIDATRDRIVENLLVRDQPPLWSRVQVAEQRAAARRARGSRLEEIAADVWGYARQHPDRMSLHLLAFAVLAWLMSLARSTLQGRLADEAAVQPEDDAVSSTARLATRHPIAAAALVALLAAPVFHGPATAASGELGRLLLVIPLVFVLRQLLGERLRGPLYLLAAFYLADRVRETLAGGDLLGRLLFLGQLAVGAAVLVWLLRSARLERLEAAARGNRWLVLMGVWARLSLGTLLFSTVAGVAGYMRIAHLLGDAVFGSAYTALALYAVTRIAESVTAVALRGNVLGRLHMVARHRELLVRRSRWLLRLAGGTAWALGVLGMLALRKPFGEAFEAVLATSIGYGSFVFTVGGLAAFFLTIAGAWVFSRLLNFVLEEEVYPRVELPRGIPFALSTLARYAILLAGFLVAIGALGFDLDRITILLGAFGVGIGFGLQNVVSNFVSGLILLFERPVKVGDRVELADLEGEVRRIGIRATTVRTWDGADVIVPNASLISDRVVNWTFADRLRRITVPVGVAYGTDPHRVIRILHDVATSHPEVRREPEPMVVFLGFGDSSLDFEIRAWTDKAEQFPAVRSSVTLAAHDALLEADIEIPFPQRDLHLRSVSPKARGPSGSDPE